MYFVCDDYAITKLKNFEKRLRIWTINFYTVMWSFVRSVLMLFFWWSSNFKWPRKIQDCAVYCRKNIVSGFVEKVSDKLSQNLCKVFAIANFVLDSGVFRAYEILLSNKKCAFNSEHHLSRPILRFFWPTLKPDISNMKTDLEKNVLEHCYKFSWDFESFIRSLFEWCLIDFYSLSWKLYLNFNI